MPLNFTDPVWALRWMKSIRTGVDYEDDAGTNCHEIATESQEVEENSHTLSGSVCTNFNEAVQEPEPAANPPEIAAEKQQETEIPLMETEIGQLTLF